MKFLNPAHILLIAALLTSACSNISPYSKQSGSSGGTGSSGIRAEALHLDPATGPDSVSSTTGEIQGNAGAENSSQPAQEFKFEEEPKRKEIEIPVVNLSESGTSGEKDPAGQNAASCAGFKGLAGSWVVSKDKTALRVENFILMQDFDGVKSYSASSTKTGSLRIRTGETEQKDDSGIAVESNVTLTGTESFSARFQSSTCILTLTKDLEESSAAYRVDAVKADGSEFHLKTCFDDSCKTAGDSLEYRKFP